MATKTKNTCTIWYRKCSFFRFTYIRIQTNKNYFWKKYCVKVLNLNTLLRICFEPVLDKRKCIYIYFSTNNSTLYKMNCYMYLITLSFYLYIQVVLVCGLYANLYHNMSLIMNYVLLIFYDTYVPMHGQIPVKSRTI